MHSMRFERVDINRALHVMRSLVEKNVIMNEGWSKTRNQLESRGFSVFELPLTEFIKAGGNAK